MKHSIRQQQKETTRREILAAAKHLFLVHGYDATTTRQIADAAGVGTGTVFAHFSDKNRLLRELLFRDIENILVMVKSELTDHMGAVDALLNYANHLYTYYRSQWTLSQILLQDVMFNASDYKVQLDAFIGELARRLTIDAPILDENDRTILAQCLMANYFMVLINGLGMPDSTLNAWLNQLEKSCRLLVRPFQSQNG